MEEHDGIDFLPYLYIELQSQLTEPYSSLLQVLGMIHRETAKLANGHVTLSTSGKC